MIYTNDFFALGSSYPNDNLVQLVDSFTLENVNFKKTSVWHTGVPMTPALADGIIYRQKGTDYYVDVDWLTNRTVYVKRFGAKGDGITNDVPAIKRMISFLPEKDFIVVFENAKYIQGDGTYPRYPLVNGVYSGNVDIGEEIFFSFENKSDFTIYGNGAVIKAHPNNAPIANARGFEFIRCQNFRVQDLNYDGSINTRKPDGGDNAMYNNQSGFKVSSSQRYELMNCRSDNTCMDGFIIVSDDIFENIDNWNEDGILRNCHADNNYRQGCSIVNSKRFKVLGGSYTNTGKTYGTLPKDGIDIEEGYNSLFGRGSNNTVIEGVLFENNLGDGLALHLGTHNASVSNCVFKNNSFAVAQDWEAMSRNNTIYNNNFYDSSIKLSGGGEHFYGNRIYLSPTFPFNFLMDNEYDHFANKKCRETLIYDNYLYRDPGKQSIGNVPGTLNIGESKDGVRIFKNTFINIASTGSFLYIHGPVDRKLEFYDNIFHNTEEFITNTSMNPANIYYTNYEGFFKKAYNNRIEIPGMPEMVSTAHRSTGDKLVKGFQLKRIPAGKYVDITFDRMSSNFEAAELYLKVTTRGYWFENDSTHVKEEIISISDVKPVSYSGTLNDFKKLPVSTGLYIKNDKATLTFSQSSSDAGINNLWNLDITIEVLGNYTDDFPMKISDYYDMNTQPPIISLPMTKSASQADSSALDLTALRNDFNNLLLKLRSSGVMQS
ncbi:right-handed parallel beta-helix repeat-containing protein [Chryseobacterium sp. G0240]|uniref:right-handed parallel beta-helix repeat-containing protein n=1 Tax=Chryseobacterium sp. G0240 TaxID=2487066 RepID=UPI000F45022C|nr:right-handed parallel beta-helix repeat-containing protein [Chryseobacterium sp. G0240]ROI01893.1 right-handed parallel beta-helix repeat-containing protein [Chryseobacterium sp. G0240]